MKNTKLYFCIVTTLFSSSAHCLNWTQDDVVSYVRTYDGITYSIGLESARCDGQKDYYYVTGMKDNKGFAAIALTALTSGKKVRISYQLDAAGVQCIVDGIWILH